MKTVSYWTEIVKTGLNKGRYALFLRKIDAAGEHHIIAAGIFRTLDLAEMKIEKLALEKAVA